jgi:predicted permease
VNLFLTVLQVVAPVFLLASVGFFWVKLGFEYRLQFVTRMSMSLAVPALIFTALMKAEIDPAALNAVVMATLAAYIAVTVVVFGLLQILKLDLRVYLAPLTFGNTGNLGLPLALFAFGDEGLTYAVVVFAAMAIYSFTFGVWVISGGGSPTKMLKEPMVAATALGGLFLWQGWQTPPVLTNALELIGQMAIPLMLITLGVAVARLEYRNVTRAGLLSAAKVVICIPTAVLAGYLFALAPVPFAVLVLQVATPVAVTSYLLAEKFQTDPDAVAGLVVVSTFLSIVVLPVTLAFLL